MDNPATDLTNRLWFAVHERYPFLKEPKFNDWAEDIDKINRIDGYEWNLIQHVLDWSQDDKFWRMQIRSGANLRKHFEKLLIQIKEKEDSRSRVYKV
jgi:hypothetical protein